MRYVRWLGITLGASIVPLAPSVAAAHRDGTGGAATPQRPLVRSVSCEDGSRWACRPGARITVKGEELRGVRSVTFLGRAGRSDDTRLRPQASTSHRLAIVVPARAKTGPLLVRSATAGKTRTRRSLTIATASTKSAGDVIVAGGTRSAEFRYRAAASANPSAAVEVVRLADGAVVVRWPLEPASDGTGVVEWDGTVDGVPQANGRYAFRIAGATTAEAAAEDASKTDFSIVDGIFPIRGKHDLGQSATNGFGGGRGHKGQDMFAACGTPLVAAQAGKVAAAQYHSAAGYYVVIKRPDGVSHAYMHMQGPSLVGKGTRVKAGQEIGVVGESGRASGCHLHFELWTAPGWYSGGKAIDPLPTLEAWDATT